MVRRLKLYTSIIGYALRHHLDFAREHHAFFEKMREDLRGYGVELDRCRVLDVGCGKSYWLTLLLHSAGARATGIDTEFVEPGRGPGKYLGILRHNGLDRTLRTLVWDWTFGRWYYRELRERCPFPLRFAGVELRSQDVTATDYPDDTFDLVVSHEVFEHLSDLGPAARELSRLLKPGGLTYIYFHNFASLSGGHHIAWKYPDSEPSTTVPPWDHLRRKLYPDIPSWINRLRVRDYRAAFEPCFEILDWMPLAREGEALLTPEIRAELAEYSEEELLTKGYVIVARPLKTGIKT